MMNRLQQRGRLGNLRSLKILPKGLIDFSSNDYLGLGSTGSRLLTGNSVVAEELESHIAAFHGFESGLLFNCGYMANLGLISILEGTILFDAAVHASTRDGIRLSSSRAFAFRHNDLEHLESRLRKSQQETFICIESIYSTDGSVAPLQEIKELADRYGAHLIVDEAHAVGVWGPQGRGLVDVAFAKVVTFGKALGAHGAIVLGSKQLRELLINFATPFIYTTALPFYSLAAIKSSYDLFPQFENERAHIQQLMQILRSSSHIHAVKIPGNEQAKQAAGRLVDRGFDVRPLLSPTVQRGHELLRISLHAFNTPEQVRTLCKELW
jgi:8-amino-7-oxononanoate synthase